MHYVLVHQGAFHRLKHLDPAGAEDTAPAQGFPGHSQDWEPLGIQREREVGGSGMCFLHGSGTGCHNGSGEGII